MPSEEEMVSALRQGNIDNAKSISDQLLASGVRTETVYLVQAEWFLGQGDVNQGMPIIVEVVRQSGSANAVSMLILWLNRLVNGYVPPKTGTPLKINIGGDVLEQIFGVVTAALSRHEGPASLDLQLSVSQGVGSIGYNVDDTTYKGYGAACARLCEALRFDVNELTAYVQKCRDEGDAQAGVTFRSIAYFLAAAGRGEEAESFMVALSDPVGGDGVRDDTISRSGSSVDYAETYQTPQIERMGRRLLERIPDARLGDVLDIGCGPGSLGGLIGDRADRLIGVDLSQDFCNHARQLGIYESVHAADFSGWESHGQTFDTAVSRGLAYLLPDYSRFVEKTAGLLRPGGLFAFDAMTCGGDADERTFYEYILRTPEYLCRIANDAGLELLEELVAPHNLSVGRYMVFRKR